MREQNASVKLETSFPLLDIKPAALPGFSGWWTAE